MCRHKAILSSVAIRWICSITSALVTVCPADRTIEAGEATISRIGRNLQIINNYFYGGVNRVPISNTQYAGTITIWGLEFGYLPIESRLLGKKRLNILVIITPNQDLIIEWGR